MLADATSTSFDVTQLGVAGLLVAAFGIALRVVWGRLGRAEDEIRRLNEQSRADAQVAFPALERASATTAQAMRVIERLTQYGRPQGGGDG